MLTETQSKMLDCLTNQELSNSEKVIYCFICTNYPDLETIISNNTLGILLNLKGNTISKLLSDMQKKGLIRIEIIDNNKRTIKII